MNFLLHLVVAIFCPPLAVFMHWGCCSHLVLNLFLTSFVWILGIGHAWVIIFVSVVTTWQDNIMEFVKEFQANPKVSANDKVEDEVAVEVEENLQKDTPDTQ